MKFENMPNNNEKTPEKANIALTPDKAPNLEILDNFKNMQKLLSDNLISSNLNNNIFQQQQQQPIPATTEETTPTNHDFKERFSDFYDSIEPSTSKLKKILMTSKSQEPINLTNYRKHTVVTSLESPGALVGGDTEKEFHDSSVCDRISSVVENLESPAKIEENSESTKERTLSQMTAPNLDSTISGSLSSLSSPNVSGSGIVSIFDAEITPESNNESPKEFPLKVPGSFVESPVNLAPNWAPIIPETVKISSTKKSVPGTLFQPFLAPFPNASRSKENVTSSTLKSRLPITTNYNTSPLKSSLSAKNPEIAGILASTLSTPPKVPSNLVGNDKPHQTPAAALAPNITAILTAKPSEFLIIF
jgi:hypothetical protein